MRFTSLVASVTIACILSLSTSAAPLHPPVFRRDVALSDHALHRRTQGPDVHASVFARADDVGTPSAKPGERKVFDASRLRFGLPSVLAPPNSQMFGVFGGKTQDNVASPDQNPPPRSVPAGVGGGTTQHSDGTGTKQTTATRRPGTPVASPCDPLEPDGHTPASRHAAEVKQWLKGMKTDGQASDLRTPTCN
ncbi:hypothetical protein H0H93_010071 [Arthromyces matolae]|nr:hypothetical protein H0H93_010071 [Arthromyces matolae]